MSSLKIKRETAGWYKEEREKEEGAGSKFRPSKLERGGEGFASDHFIV
jgi:hypothetical protein